MGMCMCCSSKTSPLASIESEVNEEVENEANEEAEELAGEVELNIRAKTLVEEEAQTEESAQEPALINAQEEKADTPAEPLGEDTTNPASRVTQSIAFFVVSVLIGDFNDMINRMKRI